MRIKIKGFTLVELIVTVAILAIVALIAAPSMTSMRYNQELKEMERKISLTLNDARSNSKALNKPMNVYFSTPTAGDPANTLYVDVDANKYEMPSTPNKVLFQSNGVLDLPIGTSSICFQVKHKKSEKIKSIKLNRFGMQELKDSACGG